MPFDFYQTYLQAPNDELMKIVRQPDDYLPEAVEAALQVLTERNVTDTTQEAADNVLDKLQRQQSIGNKRIEKIDENKKDWIESFLLPEKNLKASRWVQFIILYLLINFVWQLYVQIRNTKFLISQVIDCTNDKNVMGAKPSWFECVTYIFNIFYLFQLAATFYTLIICFLLFKKKKWGWILLTFEKILSIGNNIYALFMTTYHPNIYRVGFTVTILNIAISSAIIFILLKKMICDHFSISKDLKKKTITVSIVSLLVLHVVIRMIS